MGQEILVRNTIGNGIALFTRREKKKQLGDWLWDKVLQNRSTPKGT